jgi:transposase
MYFGTGEGIPAELATRGEAARRARLQANRSVSCDAYPALKAPCEHATHAQVAGSRLDGENSRRRVQNVQTRSPAAERELAATAKADPIARRLMTVPGVGPPTSVRFVAALDELIRFSGAHVVESYLGLLPGENSSSERQRRTSITKAGPTALRWCLVQAAWAARRTRRKDPMQRWADEVEKRRGRRVAVLALARKLAGIVYAIRRNGGVYEPRCSSAPDRAGSPQRL